MLKDNDKHPWDELVEYRGKLIKGFWPTLPELLRLSTLKFRNKVAFSVFSAGNKHSLRLLHKSVGKTESDKYQHREKHKS